MSDRGEVVGIQGARFSWWVLQEVFIWGVVPLSCLYQRFAKRGRDTDGSDIHGSVLVVFLNGQMFRQTCQKKQSLAANSPILSRHLLNRWGIVFWLGKQKWLEISSHFNHTVFWWYHLALICFCPNMIATCWTFGRKLDGRRKSAFCTIVNR